MVTTLAVVYAGDYASLALRFPNHREQFGSVTVRPLLAVPQKNGKTEFLNDEPVDTPCVHSLFPHFGASPCWYLEKHRQPRVNM